MRSLNGVTRDDRPPASPEAPRRSRLGWRLARLWRRRGLRRAILVQGPALMLLGAAVYAASDRSVHAYAVEQARAIGDALTARPRFAVARIEVEGASAALERRLRATLADAEGASSLQLDPGVLRARIEALGEVAGARVALEAPDTLRIGVTERKPAALWRVGDRLALVDADGAVIAPVAARADHPDLPLLAGAGADRAAREGLALLAVAVPLRDRLRGLVRVGERRWDLALTRDQVVMLPAERPVDALEQALELDRRHDLLERDVIAIDLRLPQKPTLRLGPDALTARAERLEAEAKARKSAGGRA